MGSFCVLPWIHLYGSVDGVWGRCCVDASTYAAHDARRRALPADALGCAPHSPHAPLNPDRVVDPEGAFNGQALKTTRLEMLRGTRVAACSYCDDREQLGARSYRQIANEMFLGDADVEETIRSTRPDGHVDGFPTYLDLRLGNACNLACVMCDHPTSSTIGIRQGIPPALARIDPYAPDDRLWQLLERHAPGLRRIYFAGGEPLLQPMHFRLLDLLIRCGRPEQTTVAYNTNLTIVPRGWLDRLRKFQAVDIGASCDGVGAVFESIRIGARWEVFARHVRQVRAVFPIRLAVTPQRANVAHLGDIIEWAIAEDCQVDLSNVLIHPRELSIMAMPADVRASHAVPYLDAAARYRARGVPGISDQLLGIVAVLRGDGPVLPPAQSPL